MNPIVKFIVREPGCCAWGETYGHLEPDARELCREAREAGLKKAQIYAEHENGDVTGPY
jgi:hypothetical protein